MNMDYNNVKKSIKQEIRGFGWGEPGGSMPINKGIFNMESSGMKMLMQEPKQKKTNSGNKIKNFKNLV